MNRFYKLTALPVLAMAFAFSCSALFTACDKSATADPPAPPPEKPGTRLFEIIADDGNSTIKENYYYRADSLLEKVTDTTWPPQSPDLKNILEKREYQRDNNKQVVKCLYTGGAGVEAVIELLKVPNHVLVWRTTYKTPTPTIYEHWIGFDNNNRIIADTTFDVTNNRIADYRVYTYDTNDNIVTEEYFLAHAPVGFINMYSNTYTYDQKKNPFYFKDAILMGLRYAHSYPGYTKNNILTIDYLNKLTGVKTNARTYTYTYNSDDLPVTRSYNFNGGAVSLQFFYK